MALPDSTEKPGFHPRNRAAYGYDFAALCALLPPLERHVIQTPAGMPSIDFSRPEAVKLLNRALLLDYYGIDGWNIPKGFLCPPIPGRADYIHHLADLLAECNDGDLPPPERVLGLDIGTGANGVYPLVGHGEYGWRFVASDIEQAALDNVTAILSHNPPYKEAITLRLQPVSANTFTGLLRKGEIFDFSMCNPPFHNSPTAAQEASQRKWRQLGKTGAAANLNFGGQSNELWCPGGERAFIQNMIEQSAIIPKRCLWFTSLVSQEANLKPIEGMLKKAKVAGQRVIEMAQGQKRSRIVAWTFHNPTQIAEWRAHRWQTRPHKARADTPRRGGKPV